MTTNLKKQMELMARESDAEIARITGLLFDQMNENKELKRKLETLLAGSLNNC